MAINLSLQFEVCDVITEVCKPLDEKHLIHLIHLFEDHMRIKRSLILQNILRK